MEPFAVDLCPPRFSGPGGPGAPRWMVLYGVYIGCPNYCEWIVPVDLEDYIASPGPGAVHDE